VFENGVLRRISGPKREEVAGSRRTIWAGNIARMGEMRNSCKILCEGTSKT